MPSQLSILLQQLPALSAHSSFQIKQKDLSKKDIADNYMDNGIADDSFFDLGLSRRFNYTQPRFLSKLGCAQIDVVHSSIFLQPINKVTLKPNASPIITGRLPPFFQKIGRVEKNIINTEMANESHYWFLSWRPFDITMPAYNSRIIITGAEYKHAIKKTNANICESQLGDMIRSNCFSASMYTLCELACLVSKRALNNITDKQAIESCLRGLLGLMHRFAQNHFGIGVANNKVVITKIQQAIDTVEQQGYGYLLYRRLNTSKINNI